MHGGSRGKAPPPVSVPAGCRTWRAAGRNPPEATFAAVIIAGAAARLNGHGRLLIRKSGTEPLIRVMAEALDAELMQRALALVADAVKAQA